MRSVFGQILLAIFVVGCSSPQSSNQSNFSPGNPTAQNLPGSSASSAENTTQLGGQPHASTGTDVREGILHYWPLDETDGDVAHDIQGNNHGSLRGWRTGRPRWVNGRIGQALQFADVENVVMTAKKIDAQQFTISFWLEVQNEMGTNPRIIHPWAALNYEHGRGVGVVGEVIEPTKPSPGQWYHYAIVIDLNNQSATIYRDGMQVTQNRLAFKPDEGALVFGHNQDPGNQSDSLNGLIDEIRVYGRMLTADEIAQLAKWSG